MNLLKRSQENLIAEETAKLFCASSINNVTIKDIANHLGIGEATIYRHYGNKYNLVLSVANYLQSKVYKDYFSFDKLTSGYEQISNFYKSYLNIYKENPKSDYHIKLVK